VPDVIIGLDLARPDSDMTAYAEMRDGIMQSFRVDLPPARSTRTAVEIEMRIAEHMAERGHLYERMRNAWPIRSILEAKTPCIRYGRRKRKWRRVIGSNVGLLTGKMWQWH